MGVRTIGGLHIAAGVWWLLVGVAGTVTLNAVANQQEDPYEREVLLIVASMVLWMALIHVAAYAASATGLLLHKQWGRALTFAVAPISILTMPILGLVLAISSMVILSSDDAEPWFK